LQEGDERGHLPAHREGCGGGGEAVRRLLRDPRPGGGHGLLPLPRETQTQARLYQQLSLGATGYIKNHKGEIAMKIGVIGAGTMGQGIAKAFAQVEGNTVVLCDIKQEWADNGKAKIAKGYDRLVAKGKMTKAKADEICAAITAGVKEDLCADCDLIVEAAFEDMKVKQTTFAELDKICKPECIFASNTSSLSITEIGKGLSRPLVGMHFFNPADRMKLIEVIAGGNTPVETVEKIKEISVAIGKQPVQVNEAAGF